jgi:hypothetical protein
MTPDRFLEAAIEEVRKESKTSACDIFLASDLSFWLLVEALCRFFLGRIPVVFNDRLLGNRGFVQGQVKRLPPSMEFGRKPLNMHTLLPESRSYFTKQPRALGDVKFELFHL